MSLNPKETEFVCTASNSNHAERGVPNESPETYGSHLTLGGPLACIVRYTAEKVWVGLECRLH